MLVIVLYSSQALVSVCLADLEGEGTRGGLQGGRSEEPIEIVHADAGTQGGTRRELVGNVQVRRGGMKLRADRVVYRPREEMLEAWGDVKLQDPVFRLSCRRLTLNGRSNEVVAWGAPVLRQEELDGAGGRTVTTLSGMQVRIFIDERRIQVFDEVELARSKEDGGKKNVELRVRCKAVEALSGIKRSTFKGGVWLDTPSVGARAQRALYDRMAGRFYLPGGAEAWNYSTSGARTNVIEGDKIIYFIREKRTIVIGNVTADVEPDVKTGPRPLPLHSSPGEMDGAGSSGSGRVVRH